MTLLAGLLPDGVAYEEIFGRTRDFDGELFPQERAVVAHAVGKRRREFAAVRLCARRALIRLGHEPRPILPGDHGAPRWPEGIVGSMTHCDGYAAAAVATDAAMRAIGIDAEPGEPLPDGVLDVIALPSEARALEHLAARRPGVSWDRILFSAKESVYKAWFPLARTWLGFEEAEVTIDPAAGTFRARLLVPGPVIGGMALTRFEGRWAAARGLVLTAVTLPAA